MIYFDMDGVLADFDRGVAELCDMRRLQPGEVRTDEEDARMWEKIREAGHFYKGVVITDFRRITLSAE